MYKFVPKIEYCLLSAEVTFGEKTHNVYVFNDCTYIHLQSDQQELLRPGIYLNLDFTVKQFIASKQFYHCIPQINGPLQVAFINWKKRNELLDRTQSHMSVDDGESFFDSVDELQQVADRFQSLAVKKAAKRTADAANLSPVC